MQLRESRLRIPNPEASAVSSVNGPPEALETLKCVGRYVFLIRYPEVFNQIIIEF